MLSVLWDTRNYFFWLILASLICFCIERIAPWRREQKALRVDIGQDLFWLVFNGHYAGILVASLAAWSLGWIERSIGGWPLASPAALQWLLREPLWVQFIVFIVVKDLLEWLIHNLLHAVPALWQFHKLHHSIEELDWVGNFRFHWMEIALYKGLTYFPLIVLGVDGRVVLWVAIVGTLIGHLNHANVRIDWGPLRYVLNSSRMHVWHHDVELHGRHGQNFAVIFSLWDWVFGTAYLPVDRERPARLGFANQRHFPRGLLRRFLYPFWK